MLSDKVVYRNRLPTHPFKITMDDVFAMEILESLRNIKRLKNDYYMFNRKSSPSSPKGHNLYQNYDPLGIVQCCHFSSTDTPNKLSAGPYRDDKRHRKVKRLDEIIAAM